MLVPGSVSTPFRFRFIGYGELPVSFEIQRTYTLEAAGM